MSNNHTETTNYTDNTKNPISYPHISRSWYGVGLLALVIPALCVCIFCIFVIVHGKLYRKTKLYILMVSQVAMNTFKVTISFYVLASLFIFDTNQPNMEHYDVQAIFGDAELYAYQGQLLHHLALAVVRLMHMMQRPNSHSKWNTDTINANLAIAVFIWISGAIIFGVFKTTCMTFGYQQFYPRYLMWGIVKQRHFTSIPKCFSLYWTVFQYLTIILTVVSYLAILILIYLKSKGASRSNQHSKKVIHNTTPAATAAQNHMEAQLNTVYNDVHDHLDADATNGSVQTASADEQRAMLNGHANDNNDPSRERRPPQKSAPNNTCTTNSQTRKAELKLVIFLAANTFCQVINSAVWHVARSTMWLFPLTDVINSAIGSILYLLQLEQIRSHAKAVLCGGAGMHRTTTTTRGTTMATINTNIAVTTQQD